MTDATDAAADETVDETAQERANSALRYIGIHGLTIRDIGRVEPDQVVQPGHPAHPVLARRKDAVVVPPEEVAAEKKAAARAEKKAAERPSDKTTDPAAGSDV